MSKVALPYNVRYIVTMENEYNTCPKCGQSVAAPFKAHIDALGGCPEGHLCGQETDWPGQPCRLFGGHPGGHLP